MEDKRDPDMDNDEIGNSNEEDIVDSADDEFEDAEMKTTTIGRRG